MTPLRKIFILEFGQNIWLPISKDGVPQFSATSNQYYIHPAIFYTFLSRAKYLAVDCGKHIYGVDMKI